MKEAYFLLCFLLASALIGQKTTVNYTQETMTIDGILDESVWKKTYTSGSFIQNFPYDTCDAIAKTEFWLASDEEYLYAAFKCYNTGKKKGYTVQSLQRDFSVNSNDAVVLTLEPFLDGQNGFSFGVTPQNAQREGSVGNGGNFGVSTAWDQVWFSATNIQEEFWTAEFKIPYKSIRFNHQNQKWRTNVARIDFKNNEKSCWVRVPRNFNISSLTYTGDMNWEKKPPKQNFNLTLVPYVSATGNQNISSQKGIDIKPKTGIDAKFSLSSSLNLDLTLNPDFAQVDVDVQQINLTHFNLFFPERRQFFIENSDLFANFGFRGIRPFFSRRVGLAEPITAGARITGKIGNKWRVGIMDVATRELDSLTPAKNYAIAAFQRKVFSSSNIGFIFVNDRVRNMPGSTVTGLEYNLLSKDNKWVGKAFYQKSISPKIMDRSFAHASFLIFRNTKWRLEWNHEFAGKGFRAPTGFVPRQRFYDQENKVSVTREFWRLENSAAYTIYPKSNLINKTSFIGYHSSYYDSAQKSTESFNAFRIKNTFQNSAELNLRLSRQKNTLFLPFSPISTDSNYLLGEYDWNSLNVFFQSNRRKLFNLSVDATAGQFYDGSKYGTTVKAIYRRQPWGVFSVNYQREQISLPSIGDQTYDLIGAKAEISFTTTMYLNTFLQYNTQANNTNLYIRYQWRYRPMSDLFLVYSENYNQYWKVKNRNLAFKFVYWLNL